MSRQELDLMILTGPFQLRMFCDSVTWKVENRISVSISQCQSLLKTKVGSINEAACIFTAEFRVRLERREPVQNRSTEITVALATVSNLSATGSMCIIQFSIGWLQSVEGGQRYYFLKEKQKNTGF